VKRRRGTLRRDRDGGAPLVVLPNVSSAPPPADDKSGRDFITEVLESGASTWIGVTDLPTLEIARQLWEDRRTARAEYLSHPGDKDAAASYMRITRELVACLSALGLDPAARARLGVAEIKRRSVAEELLAKRAERRAGHRAG
jgi:hypothetical protein